MPRGPKKHLKRLVAPSSWMLDKLGGVFTIKPSSGPHKQGESLPVALFLRNRLKYALNMKEVETIMKQRLIKIDGKTRTDPKFPTGFMDVVQIEKTGENFRIIYDVKGRFIVHRITASEAAYKLCKVKAVSTGPKGVPYLHTNDGRTIRYPDPNAKVHDSIQLDLATNKVQDCIKFEVGNLCMITGGANSGRVGTMMSREKHPGSFDIVHIKDSQGHVFATRLGYVFVIGKGNKPFISLPKGKGIKLSIAEERDKRLGVK
jgi:small subunit ribosomal protein S4e